MPTEITYRDQSVSDENGYNLFVPFKIAIRCVNSSETLSDKDFYRAIKKQNQITIAAIDKLKADYDAKLSFIETYTNPFNDSNTAVIIQSHYIAFRSPSDDFARNIADFRKSVTFSVEEIFEKYFS